MCFAHIEKLQEGDHNGKKSLIRWSIEKICSVQSSQLFAGNSGDSIHTEVKFKFKFYYFYTIYRTDTT